MRVTARPSRPSASAAGSSDDCTRDRSRQSTTRPRALLLPPSLSPTLLFPTPICVVMSSVLSPSNKKHRADREAAG